MANKKNAQRNNVGPRVSGDRQECEEPAMTDIAAQSLSFVLKFFMRLLSLSLSLSLSVACSLAE